MPADADTEARLKALEKQNEKLVKQVNELKIANENLQAKIPVAGVGPVVEKLNATSAINTLPPFFGESADSSLKIKMLINMVEQLAKDNPHLANQRCMMIRAKFRAQALEFLSSSGELQTESDWELFKEKLLEQYDRKQPESLVMSDLSNCTMTFG